MPTTDERREVAAKLRDYESLRETLRESPICAFLDALGVGYLSWEGICNRLADLIEPEERTCHVVARQEGIGVVEHELSCGHGCEWVWAFPPAFCPNCGARVKEGE